MFNRKTILSQMQELIFGYEFEKTVLSHNGDKGMKVFSTKNLMSIMLYVQMGAKESLRDIVDSLNTKSNLWYHLGLRSISRNNLSHSLANRSFLIFQETYFKLLNQFQNQTKLLKNKRFKFKNPVKVLDSTTISLCLSLFDWAKFTKYKGGIKLHIGLDSSNQIPEFINISNAKEHDVKSAKNMPVSKGSILVFDKAYICFDLFKRINETEAFFVTRTKTNTLYKVVERLKKKHKNIIVDWKVKYNGTKKESYPDTLRVVKYYDEESKKTYEFLTNNFTLSAKTIADIYKSRWDVELFFKWIKQNLKIKTFIGTSENAVKIQIFTALIALLLVKYLQHLSKSNFSLLQIFRILKDNILHCYEIFNLLNNKYHPNSYRMKKFDSQLSLNF